MRMNDDAVTGMGFTLEGILLKQTYKVNQFPVLMLLILKMMGVNYCTPI